MFCSLVVSNSERYRSSSAVTFENWSIVCWLTRSSAFESMPSRRTHCTLLAVTSRLQPSTYHMCGFKSRHHVCILLQKPRLFITRICQTRTCSRQWFPRHQVVLIFLLSFNGPGICGYMIWLLRLGMSGVLLEHIFRSSRNSNTKHLHCFWYCLYC